MNTEQPGIPEWLAKDNAEAERCADWLIRIVNADHQDKIEFNRDIGCRIRDHIERLRKDVAEQKRKYFEIERAHSRAVDKISDLTERVQLREKDLAERGAQKAKTESDLAEAREDASQNTDRYLACEKRFEEAIAQRDAANLRVEGMEKGCPKCGHLFFKDVAANSQWTDDCVVCRKCGYSVEHSVHPTEDEEFRRLKRYVVSNEGYKVRYTDSIEAENAALTTRLEGLIRDNQASAAEVVELRQENATLKAMGTKFPPDFARSERSSQ